MGNGTQLEGAWKAGQSCAKVKIPPATPAPAELMLRARCIHFNASTRSRRVERPTAVSAPTASLGWPNLPQRKANFHTSDSINSSRGLKWRALVPRRPRRLVALVRPLSTSAQHNQAPNTKQSDNQEEFKDEKLDDVPDPFQETRIQLLETALQLVPKYGWTVECLAAAAEKCGLPSTAHGLALNGAAELVFYFVAKCNRSWVAALGEVPMDRMTLKERLAFVIKKRLEYNIPVVKQGRWAEALAASAKPGNLPSTLEQIALLADEICYQTGDKSTDLRWYSKRLFVSTVYSSAELFMLTDTSTEYKDTWDFVDRRIENLIQASKVQEEAGTLIYSVALGLASLLNPFKRN